MINSSKYFKTYMFRPIIYRIISKLCIGMTVALLWNRYINIDDFYSVVEFVFFVIGIFFVVLTWIDYLRLDGIKIHGIDIFKLQKNKKHNPTHWMKDMVDYVDEPAPSFEKLTDNEHLVVSLVSNILTGCFFLFPSILSFIILM